MRNRKTRKIGGRKLGSGMRGDVYVPPLKCAEGDDKQWASNDYVSKDIHPDFLEIEYRNSFLIKALDLRGEWSVTALHACTINQTQENTNWRSGEKTHQLIFKNGGKDLYSLLLRPGFSGDSNKYINGFDDEGNEDTRVYDRLDIGGVSNVIQHLHRILPKLDILNEKYIHGDLHFGNIVTDGFTPRIIDFSSLRPVSELLKDAEKDYNSCYKLIKPYDKCMTFNIRLPMLIEDTAKSKDVMALWAELYLLLDSKWVKSAFHDKYTEWLQKYENLYRFVSFRSDYISSMLYVPSD
jgi:hypothetical protein